ncbi:hypothetical protein D3C72_1741730 [compost metagenome]
MGIFFQPDWRIPGGPGRQLVLGADAHRPGGGGVPAFPALAQHQAKSDPVVHAGGRLPARHHVSVQLPRVHVPDGAGIPAVYRADAAVRYADL